MLLAAGADINLMDKEGDTPLHWAAKANYMEAARTLIDGNASIGILILCVFILNTFSCLQQRKYHAFTRSSSY